MAATVAWMEYIDDSASPDAGLDVTSDPIYFLSEDLHSSDENASLYPISVPAEGANYSFERWLRIEISGTFNLINNMEVYQSGGTLNQGWTININDESGDIVEDSWSAPVGTESLLATTALGVGSENAHALYASDGVSDDFETSGNSAWIVLQAVLDDTASSGDMSDDGISLRFAWDEQ